MRLVGFLFAIVVALPSAGIAATLPTGFTETLVASALSSPTAMQFAPDGRLFICEQGGRLRVVKNGVLLTTPFLTIPSTAISASGERGLLGVAFDPAFGTNQFVYIYYTATSPTLHNRISRFTANGDVAVAGSETMILDLDNLSGATNHNGGALAFGPDGKLYAAVGENANGANAQTLANLLGKMLRINKDGTIPADNPFFTAATGRNRAIWALGLRNPFTFAFNPAGAELFINDVGQNTWEEINDGIAGANYGWPTTEGATTNPIFRSPRYSYNHSTPGVCAITGGAFYSPMTAQFPSEYSQDYFFADFCGGWIRRLDVASGNVTTFATGIASPVDLKVSDDGALYYLARGANAVYRVTYGTTAPAITAHPASQTVQSGAPVTFSVVASGTPTLRYQWQRGGADIAGATSQDYTIASVVPADNGARFRARVTNDFGNVLSNEAVLTVTSNQAPTGTITQPVTGTLYSGGMVVNYAGTATDPEDSPVAAGAFTWRVDFHHDTHLHPFLASTTGAASGSFTIPTVGETSANVWYRIHLTVTDSGGLTHMTQRDILPRKARLTLATIPGGLQLKLDGQPAATPLSFDSVVGIVRNIEAATPQASGGNMYAFVSWSDGGLASHNVSTPAANTTYTATFSAPTITLSAATVVAGGTVTATIVNGPGNAGDWVGLVGTAAADGSYVDWKYLNGTRTRPGSGVTGGPVAFTMPATPGSDNVRFFLNDSWTKLATSATITVTAPPPPSITLSATTVVSGGTVTATIADGPGSAGDWLGLNGASAADGTYVDWKYLNGTRIRPGSGMTGAPVAFTMPATPGTYNVRFFLNDSWTKLATSATITVTAPPPPSITLSATTVVSGGTVTVTIANGPGSAGDWLGLNGASAADGTYLDWKYLNGTQNRPGTGVTGAAVAFTMPATPGTYNVRFFLNDSWVKLATSLTITVQ